MRVDGIGSGPDLLQLHAQLASDRRAMTVHQNSQVNRATLELDQERVQQDLAAIAEAEPPRLDRFAAQQQASAEQQPSGQQDRPRVRWL